MYIHILYDNINDNVALFSDSRGYGSNQRVQLEVSAPWCTDTGNVDDLMKLVAETSEGMEPGPELKYQWDEQLDLEILQMAGCTSVVHRL